MFNTWLACPDLGPDFGQNVIRAWPGYFVRCLGSANTVYTSTGTENTVYSFTETGTGYTLTTTFVVGPTLKTGYPLTISHTVKRYLLVTDYTPNI